jgi:putative transcriptional regulator
VRLTDLAARVGIALPNLSLLKNGKVKEIRLALLDGLCRELGCQPGDLLEFAGRDGPPPHPHPPASALPANTGLEFID